MDKLQLLNDNQLPFAKVLGLKFLAASDTGVKAEMVVKPELCTRPDILHGGAVMAFADTLGAAATVLNLPEGKGTTTIESKTNFFAAVPLGDTVRAECTPLHRGRSTMVWQTRIIRGDGRLAAIVTQTQLVMRKDAGTRKSVIFGAPLVLGTREQSVQNANVDRIHLAGLAG